MTEATVVTTIPDGSEILPSVAVATAPPAGHMLGEDSEKKRKGEMGPNSVYAHLPTPHGCSDYLRDIWENGIEWGSLEDATDKPCMTFNDTTKLKEKTKECLKDDVFAAVRVGASNLGTKSRTGPNTDPSVRFNCNHCAPLVIVGAFKIMGGHHPCANEACGGRCKHNENRRLYPLFIHNPKHKPGCPNIPTFTDMRSCAQGPIMSAGGLAVATGIDAEGERKRKAMSK